MAKTSPVTVRGIKASTLALFEGVLAGAIGFVIALIHSLSQTIDLAQSTGSVITGLAFGLATGIVSIILVPLIYFGIGWLVGYLHAFVFNNIVATTGGIELDIEK